MSYNLDDWQPAPRKITVDGAVVRLAGYHAQHPGTVDVIGSRQQITLLVVPPETTSQMAHAVLMAAGHRGNTDNVEALLRVPSAQTVDDPAEQRWELDGGPVLMGR